MLQYLTANKGSKRQSVNCLPKQLRQNGSLTMFTETLCEAIKCFQSRFPKKVVYIQKPLLLI